MIPFGVTYYPDQWPMDTWDKELGRIKKAGFNCIRFGEMAWDWVEPRENVFTFKEMDRAMDLCGKHGLKVVLGLATSQAPNWLIKKYPELRPVADDGTLYPEYGPRPNVCRDSAIYRRYAKQLIEKIVKRYARHPALYMWQLDNEPVVAPLDSTTMKDFCHCKHTQATFRKWAKKKYKTIEKLNKVWGAKFWTTTFSDFDEITSPKAGIWDAVSPHIFLDWFRFKSDQLRDWLSSAKKLVRKYDQVHKVGTNGFIGICSRVPDHDKLSTDMDWYGLDVYPKGGQMDKGKLAMTLDMWRGFTSGKPAEFHITELQGGQNVRWGHPDHVNGKDIVDWTRQVFLHGARAVLFHAWKAPLFGAETYGFGLLKPDGSPTDRSRAITKVAKEVNELSGTVVLPETAIIFLRDNQVQSYQEYGPPRGIAGQWAAVNCELGLLYSEIEAEGAYRLAYKGKPIDFIYERKLNSGKLPYKKIIFPNPYLLSKKQFDILIRYVAGGGVLITDARFGLKDENAHLYPNPLIEKLIGKTYDYSQVSEYGFLDAFEGKPARPEVFVKKIGKGKIVYANFSVFYCAEKTRKGEKKWRNMDTLIQKIKNML